MRRRSFVPGVSGLEERRVPTVSVVPQGAFLIIVADAEPVDNTIKIDMVGDQVDVNINGAHNLFAPGAVATIEFDASATPSGDLQTFINNTALNTMAFGGSGRNDFYAGHGWDFFVGGPGANNFKADDGFVVFFGEGASNDFTLGTGSGFVLGSSATTAVHNATPDYWVVTW